MCCRIDLGLLVYGKQNEVEIEWQRKNVVEGVEGEEERSVEVI